MGKVLDSAIPSSANEGKGILTIGAYPDDIELGCGASPARLAQKGIYIVAVAMTTGNSGANGIIDHHEESHNTLKTLGCHRTVYPNFVDTRTYLQLNDMISALEDIIKNQIPSDVEIIRVYTVHDADRRQDHPAVCQASMVACHAISQILGYETPSTWLSFVPQVSESVKKKYLSLKLIALKKHKNQSQRDYIRPERLRAVAQFRGQRISSDLDEGFVIHKMIP